MMTKKISDNISLVWAEVDLERLRGNLRAIRSRLGRSKTQVMAVVKADAYGHGMKPVAETLAAQGVDFFGVANIDEAVELRKVCPRAKILVLGGFHVDQIPFFIKHRIRPTVFSLEDVLLLEKFLKKKRSQFPVHVKIDTGMGRLGVWHEDVEDFFKEIKNKQSIAVEGVYTHFSRADHADESFTHVQLLHFEKAVKKILACGFRPKYFHSANSMGLMRFKNSHLNLVRPGIILYGINPSSDQKLPKGIKPILSLKTRISFLKEVGKGRAISYGGTFVTQKNTRLATLPVGYSHGYRVGFSNKAHVLVRGRRCPVVGRVTMDQTLVDVGAFPRVERWDEVTLIGREGTEQILAQDLATLAGTIPYEILCAIHSRIPRIYKRRSDDDEKH